MNKKNKTSYNDSELEKLLDEIEDRHVKQTHVLNEKQEQISSLEQENRVLRQYISEKTMENDFLREELEKAKLLLETNEQKFRTEMKDRMSEMHTIMQISKKIEEQNNEIKSLEEFNRRQRLLFKKNEED